MAQLVTFGETPLGLSPPTNQRLERASEARLHADGVESNAAVAAHVLGTYAVWVSILPDSSLGRRVRSQVDAQGVQTDITWVDTDGCRQGLVFGESAPRESTRLHDREGTHIVSIAECVPDAPRVGRRYAAVGGEHGRALTGQRRERDGASPGQCEDGARVQLRGGSRFAGGVPRCVRGARGPRRGGVRAGE
jgi:hypothetical protein